MNAFEPTSTSDLLLDSECIAKVKRWIRETTGKAQVLVIQSVSVGVGISTLIRLACSELDVEPVIISSSLQKLKLFLRHISGSAYTVEMKKKVIVFDSLDAVFSEPTCAVDVSEHFKGISPIPVICAGHRLRSSASKLHDMLGKLYAVETVSFPPLEDAKVVPYLEKIRAALKRSAPIAWHGDLRNALTAIDADVTDASKDEQCDGVKAVWRVLFDPELTIRDSINMHEGDVSMITAGTHENYPSTGQSIETCARLADIYSIVDAMDEKMYATQRWELGDVCTALSSGGPVAYLDKVASQKHKHLDISKFGTFWSRGNNQRTKEKALRSIRSYMMEHGMPSSSSIDSLAIIRTIVMSQKWEDIVPLLGSIPDTTVLAIMRMFKCGFTQTQYGLLKKKRN